MSDIEDASVLPSIQQLDALSQYIGGIDSTKFEEAQRVGQIPWAAAVEEILRSNGPSSANEIAQRIAESVKGCDPAMVTWRLARELSRLEGAGTFTRASSGAWTLNATGGEATATDPNRRPAPGRWSRHAISHRHDSEHDALFHVESVPGSSEIVLNRSHPCYETLRDLLGGADTADLTPEEMRSRLEAAARMMRGLLVAWAEYEDGEKAGARRENVREMRQAWGRAAKQVARSDADAER